MTTDAQDVYLPPETKSRTIPQKGGEWVLFVSVLIFLNKIVLGVSGYRGPMV